MTSSVLILENADVVVDGRGLTRCSVVVENGRITGFDGRVSSDGAVERVDLTGLVVMPGVVDPHLHLGHGKDISRPRAKEDAARESAAAALGGMTTFIPYLMSTTCYSDLFADVQAITEAGSRIDFGYHFIISTEEQLAAVPDYAARYGVRSYKIFMNNRGGEGTRLGLPDIDDGYLFRLCETAASVGGVVCPHPENIEIAFVLRSAYLARVTDCDLYVVHTSSAAALEAAVLQRQAGTRLMIETCPHYLTHDETWSGGVVGKINPPLRRSSDCAQLWQALADGRIDTVGTDHVHRDLSGKQGSIWDASPGCPGLETLLPVLLSEGHVKRGLSLERIASLTATNPARAFGLGDRKGKIAVGQDADFAIIDPQAEWSVDASRFLSSAGYSIYDGWRLTGRVVHTVVRGTFVLRDGQLNEQAVGYGRYLPRTA